MCGTRELSLSASVRLRLTGRAMQPCWDLRRIGAQSRYQLVGVALAATIVFALIAVRARISRALMHFAVGGIAALILSAPFYLANLSAFGVRWPLLVSRINGTGAYANRLAADYTANLTGPHDPATIMFRLGELVASPALFPLAIVLTATVLLSLRAREEGSRRLALFGVLFLCIWVVMQPRLYPRNILLLLSLGPLLVAPLVIQRPVHDTARRLVHSAVVAGIVAMVAASGVFGLTIPLRPDRKYLRIPPIHVLVLPIVRLGQPQHPAGGQVSRNHVLGAQLLPRSPRIAELIPG